jgi:D-alanyl-D-alanine carboxypeptidase (penicillin-binding protein 5/6)
MAIILDCAMKNPVCREILCDEKYVTSSTPEHPNGVEMYSTMFNKIRHDQIDGVELLGGKTGYTYQAGHCLASAAERYGKTYIAVTGGGDNKYSPIYDIMELFGSYT